MTNSLYPPRNLSPRAPVSMVLAALVALLALLPVGSARAHEVSPAIADMTRDGDVLRFTVAANLEAFVAGIDLEGLADTSAADSDAAYDAARALPPEALAERFRDGWPDFAAGIVVRADGRDLPLTLQSVEVGEIGDVALARASVFGFTAALPPGGAMAVEVGWAPRYGDLVLRQQGVEAPYTGYLEPGLISEPIALGGSGRGWAEELAIAASAGIDRILPAAPLTALFGLALVLVGAGSWVWSSQAVSAGSLAMGLALGFAAAASGLWQPSPALALAGIGVSLAWLGAETALAEPETRWRLPLVALAGLWHGAALGADPLAAGTALVIAGQVAGLSIAIAAILAAGYVLTAPARRGAGGRNGAAWALGGAVLAIPVAALAGGPVLVPLAAGAGGLLALSALAGTADADTGARARLLRRPGGVLVALAGGGALAQAVALAG